MYVLQFLARLWNHLLAGQRMRIMFRSVRNGILTIGLVTGCTAPDGDMVEANSLARQIRSETLAEFYNFDGLDDYVEIAHSDDDLLDNGTLTLWFRADDLDGNQTLFSKDSSNFDTGGHLNVGLEGPPIAASTLLLMKTPGRSMYSEVRT